MKFFIALLSSLVISSCANGKERTYIASTPAGTVVRTFLGISLTDSIDFIRWKLIVDGNRYSLHCNYGISKPNTNGFISGGKNVELSSTLTEDKNHYQLQNGNHVLRIIKLNNDLVHLLDENNNLLVGNDGWSYTLNNTVSAGSSETSTKQQPLTIKDSIVFAGRTPCNIPGVIPAGTACYKLKWLIVLYTNAASNKSGSYKIAGTPYRKEGGRSGNWEIITLKDGNITYRLDDAKGNAMLYLLKLDENILIFTDAAGKLLTGDEDFSYTLNRRF